MFGGAPPLLVVLLAIELIANSLIVGNVLVATAAVALFAADLLLVFGYLDVAAIVEVFA